MHTKKRTHQKTKQIFQFIFSFPSLLATTATATKTTTELTTTDRQTGTEQLTGSALARLVRVVSPKILSLCLGLSLGAPTCAVHSSYLHRCCLNDDGQKVLAAHFRWAGLEFRSGGDKSKGAKNILPPSGSPARKPVSRRQAQVH